MTDMLTRVATPCIATAAVLMVAACALSTRSATDTAARDEHAAELLRIASEYSAYHRPIPSYLLAPELCDAPTPFGPRMSASNDETTHGRKLYLLFARHASYGHLDEPGVASTSAIGQAIVKEAWKPDVPRSLVPGERAELFVMFKVDEATPGTDRGWVYGVTTPDGREVIDVGMIASCAECHRKASHERLFGPASIPR